MYLSEGNNLVTLGKQAEGSKMAQSLKRRYETKKLTQLQERVKKVDARIISEHRASQLLVEAMSDQDLQKVSDIIDKLRSIKSPQLPVLSKAIDQAEAEINKYTGGGVLTKAWTKLKTMVGMDNPVVKVSTFADALERGFAQIPMIIKNNVGDVKNIDTTKSLATVLSDPKSTGGKQLGRLGQKSDEELGKVGKTSSVFSDDPTFSEWPGKSQNEADGGSNVQLTGRLKSVANQMLKALAPGGFFGAFKQVPYVDMKALVQELVTAPIGTLAPIIKTLQTGTKAAMIAPDMKSQITGKGDDQAKAAQPGVQPTADAGSNISSPTKDATPTTATKTGAEKNTEPRGGAVNPEAQQKADAYADRLYSALKMDFNGIDEKTVKSILSTLAYNGKLKG